MIRFGWTTFIILTLLLPATPLWAAERPPSRLMAIHSQPEPLMTVVELATDRLPSYDMSTSGQRVNIVLHDTAPGEAFVAPDESESVIRTLVARDRNDLIVSLLLRRVPLKVVANGDPQTQALSIALVWAGETVRPGIAFEMPGLPLVKSNGAALSRSPSPSSRFQGKWRSFFHDYQSPLTIPVALSATLPALPLLDESLFKAEELELRQLAHDGRWLELADRSMQAQPHTASAAARLLVAETLLRCQRNEAAHRLLETAPAPPVETGLLPLQAYLEALACARTTGPHQAKVCLERQQGLTDPHSPLQPHVRLLRAELALMTGRNRLAVEQLTALAQDSPEFLPELRELRLVDALACQDPPAALQRYRTLLAGKNPAAGQPFSLNHAAAVALSCRDLQQARNYYTLLERALGDPAQKGLARYGRLLADYLLGNQIVALDELQKFVEQQPFSEAGLRAQLTILDHWVPRLNVQTALERLTQYTPIIAAAPRRELREEAAFKQALGYHFNGDTLRSIALLNKSLRDFSRGELVNEAQVFLGEILVPTIGALLETGQVIRATVLVEQNRDLLVRQSLPDELLTGMAEAYLALGMTERACRVYLYLLDISQDENRRRLATMQLARLFWEQDKPAQALRQAQNYIDQFAGAADRPKAIHIAALCIERESGADEAAKFLKQFPMTDDPQLALWAAELYYRLDDPDESLCYLESCLKKLGSLPPSGRMIHAEALYRKGQQSEALPIYQSLLEEASLADQATYRVAEIHLGQQRTEQGLELLKQLSGSSRDPLWKRLAEISLRDAAGRM